MPQPNSVRWLKVYAIALGTCYVVAASLLAGVCVYTWDGDVPAAENFVLLFTFGVSIGICLVIGVAHLFALKLKRQSWGYFYGFGIIIWGLMLLLTIPATVPLLIKWTQPETKAWFEGKPST